MRDCGCLSPLVTHPVRIEIFRFLRVNDHDLGRAQGVVYVRLVLFGNLARQTGPAEKHAVSLIRKPSIEFLRLHAVRGALFGFVVRFLIADKNVVRLFLFRLFQPQFPDSVYLFGVFFVFRRNVVRRQLDRRLIVGIFTEGRERGVVTGGHALALARSVIVHVDYAVVGERHAEAGLVTLRRTVDNVDKRLVRFVRFAVAQGFVGVYEQNALFAVDHLFFVDGVAILTFEFAYAVRFEFAPAQMAYLILFRH